MSSATVVTTTKSGKKVLTLPTAAAPATPTSSSSSSSKSLEDLAAAGKPPSLLSLQNMLQAMYEVMTKNQEDISKNLEDLTSDLKGELGAVRDDIKMLNERLEGVQGVLTQQESKVQDVEKRMGRCEERLDGNEREQLSVNRALEEEIIFLEMERSAFYLRIQNVVEERGEPLKDIVADILAGILEITKEEVLRDIDDAFRVFTSYARRQRLPTEVHVRLSKKALREEVILKSRDKTVTYKDKQLIILKQLPRRVREMRRNYHFLTTQLRKYKILYRWLLPEGLQFTWADKKVRIDNLRDARDFCISHLNPLEADVGEESEGKSGEELLEEEESGEPEQLGGRKKGKGQTQIQAEIGAEGLNQRETRQTKKKLQVEGK